jgi:hypothetical protein
VLSERARRRIIIIACGLIILGWYLFFTWKSLFRYFDNDDMMNLYFAWSRPLAEVVRPTGGLFYRVIYGFAGFDPLPFRIVCLVIGALNIALCWWFLRMLSRSHRAAAFAALLIAFHSRLMEVWFRTGVVYDLLCFTFFYLAACLYIRTEKRGSARVCAILLCFLAALGSKEVAVALPFVLIGYELLFGIGSFGMRRLATPAVMIAIDVPYLWVKTHGASALIHNPAYRPEYSFARFAENWAIFMQYVFVLDREVRPVAAILILGAMLVIAVALRSRTLIFAWLLLFLPALPVSFLPYRGGYVLYVSYAGWVLYAAVCLVLMEDRLIQRVPRYRTAISCAAFLIVGWRWGKLNLHDQRADPRAWLHESPAQVKTLADSMRLLAPAMPKSSRVMFLNDPFPPDEWTPYFELKLLYRDDGLNIQRAKWLGDRPYRESDYDFVFDYRNDAYQCVVRPQTSIHPVDRKSAPLR